MEQIQENAYSPARLFDALLKHFGLRRDSQLADRLGMPRSSVCRIRKGDMAIGAAILIRIHEESSISIKDLRLILGDRRKRFKGRYTIQS